MSNILKVWTVDAQRELLDGVGEKLEVYHDEVKPGARKRKDAGALYWRSKLLAPTSRPRPDETIYVPCLGNFAWDIRDLNRCFAAARDRGATIVALNTKRRIPPDADGKTILEAQEEFSADKRRGPVQPGRTGWEIAKEQRDADTKRRIALIEKDWGNPAFTQEELLLRAGRTTKGGAFQPMTWKTARKYLPDRRWLLKQKAGIAKVKAARASKR